MGRPTEKSLDMSIQRFQYYVDHLVGTLGRRVILKINEQLLGVGQVLAGAGWDYEPLDLIWKFRPLPMELAQRFASETDLIAPASIAKTGAGLGDGNEHGGVLDQLCDIERNACLENRELTLDEARAYKRVLDD